MLLGSRESNGIAKTSLSHLECLTLKIESKFLKLKQTLEELQSSSALMTKKLIWHKDEFDNHYLTFVQNCVTTAKMSVKGNNISSATDATSIRSSASSQSKASSIILWPLLCSILKKAAVEVHVALLKVNHADERAKDDIALLKQKIHSLKTEDSFFLELSQVIEQQHSNDKF